MITENHKFLSARFFDIAKKTVLAQWEDPETSEVIDEVIEVNPRDFSWNHLLEHTTIEQITETTQKKVEDERNGFIVIVKDIAEKEGLILKPDQVDDDIVSMPVKDVLSSDIPKTAKDKEKLFNIKLKIFENENVKNSTDRSLKSKIRKAQSPIEAIALASSLIIKESESSVLSSE